MTANRYLIRAGYDFERIFTFLIDGSVEDLSAAAIKASLKNDAKTLELIVDTSQTNTGTDVDWRTGEVAIRFPASLTAALTAQNAWIEVAVVLAGIRLPYADLPAVVELGYVLS